MPMMPVIQSSLSNEDLIDMIKTNSTPEISFSNSGLGLEGQSIQSLVSLLNSNSHITTLLLLQNNIQDATAKILAQLQHISSLNLSNNDITIKGAIELCKNSSLQKIDLSKNNFTQGNDKDLIEAIRQNLKLKQLNLSSCGLKEETIKNISEILRKRKPELSAAVGFFNSKKFQTTTTISASKNYCNFM